jgi:hypothetical protein
VGAIPSIAYLASMDPAAGDGDTRERARRQTPEEEHAMSILPFTKKSLVILAAVAAGAIVAASVLASLAFGHGTVTKTVAVKPCGDRIYGHIKSLQRSGDHYELGFDPAWFTSGITANTAAAEDGAVDPGQPVPNDNYVVDESHRVLTYIVPDDARVTILTPSGNPLYATPSSVAELDRIVNGGSHRPLFEPLDSGMWIRVHVDAVCSLDQQYRP